MNNIRYCHKDAYEDLLINDNIISIIDRTITKIGKLKLHNILSYCSSDLDTLQRMTIRNYAISHDLEYIKKMKEYLMKIKEIENTVNNWINTECNKDLIFDQSILNNSYFLTISNKLKISSILIILIIYVIGYVYLYYYGIRINPIEYIKNLIYEYYKFLKLIMRFVLSDIRWIEWSAIIITFIYVGWMIYLSYMGFNVSYKHYCDCDIINTEYTNIYQYIDIADQMLESDIYSESNYDKIKESINYLKYYFVENQSIGISIVTKLNRFDYIKHLNIIANFIGKIDYLISIAILLSEGYLIPDFISSPFPILNIDKIWNPMIGKHSIRNSINMNVMTPNIMIVTGPNKSGKSTYMRSILLSVYLAQSLGICCADKMTLTPFRNLCTYINIKDCIAKESLFEAEVNRCYQYIEKIESLKGFSIGIIDELFTGTNSSESKAGTYAIIKRIKENPTNITILNTHFVEILDSFDQQDILFNKFVGKKDVENDKYIFDYKIYTGISDQFIALELLKTKGFDNDIIVDAYSFLLKLHKNK